MADPARRAEMRPASPWRPTRLRRAMEAGSLRRFEHSLLPLDDAPLEERRTRAVYTRRATELRYADDLGALDPAAIERVRQEAWPVANTPVSWLVPSPRTRISLETMENSCCKANSSSAQRRNRSFSLSQTILHGCGVIRRAFCSGWKISITTCP